MPAKYDPIAVRDKTAALMLDMSVNEFRQLVAKGALPSPVKIAGLDRWRVDQIKSVVDGLAARPDERGFEL